MILLCLVAAVTDGDTLRCQSGERVRIAGVEANELRGGCHVARCAAMPGPEARRVVSRLVLHRTLSCEPVGRSYRRIVARCSFADGRDLRCAIVRAGAAVDWPNYVKKYNLRNCA